MNLAYAEAHKFGGTSLATAPHFSQAISLLPSHPCIVIVSAIAGTTQQLTNCLTQAQHGQPFESTLNEVKARHVDIIAKLALQDRAQLVADITAWFAAATTVLTSIQVVKAYSPAEEAEILGLGERCSARLMTSLLRQQSRPAHYLDASDVLYTHTAHRIQTFDLPRSQSAISGFLASVPTHQVIVITGFLARNEQGQRQLLERNGSDISASLFASLFQCQQLTIWTDQAGIYTADPRIVRLATPIPQLSYHEALELAYFGTKIIHPKAIGPAQTDQRPIHIKNTAEPDAAGTFITATNPNQDHMIRGLTSIEDVALITIEGAGMLGICGISARLFSSLHHENISVILISQASSEQSICLCVPEKDGMEAQQALQHTFAFELNHGILSDIKLEDHIAIIAAVGDQMAQQIGVAGRMCNTLAKAQVNIRAIAQGASERNISLIIARDDLPRALRALHAGFYLAAKTIAIGLIGVGTVGSELLTQIANSTSRLNVDDGIVFHLRAVMNSKKMLLAESPIAIDEWHPALTACDTQPHIDSFISHLKTEDYPHTVIIDCTANPTIAHHYLDFIQQGMHVITPNKHANSSQQDYYHAIRHACQQQQRRFYYETTVCAGLPIMTTLQDIIQTGDHVLSVHGIVSGSLNYIFQQLNQGVPFSTAVTQASQQGYTEPDPREDLSGRDVARKMICLARELGMSINLADLEPINLVPKPLRDVSPADFMNQLPHYDHTVASTLSAHTDQQRHAAYIGNIDVAANRVTVGLAGFASDHPFSQLSGTDNMLILTTARYCSQPLIIRGPGAGAAVTASGIFADLLRLSSTLNQ